MTYLLSLTLWSLPMLGAGLLAVLCLAELLASLTRRDMLRPSPPPMLHRSWIPYQQSPR